MITLDKILTELKADSLNEIVAGCGGGKSGRNGDRQQSGRKRHSGCNRSGRSNSGKSGYTCGTPAPTPVVLT